MAGVRDEIPICAAETAISGEQLAEAYFDAFGADELSHACFPRTPAVRRWWSDMLSEELRDPGALFSATVVDDPAGSYVSGFSKWNLPKPITSQDDSATSVSDQELLEQATTKLGGAPREWVTSPDNPRWHLDRTTNHSFALGVLKELPQWPSEPGSDHDAASSFFSRLADARQQWEASLSPEHKSRGYYYLEMLGSLKRHRGQGLGVRHVAWAVERAATERVPCYVEASPPSVGFYTSRGFTPLGQVHVKLRGGVDFYNQCMVLMPPGSS